nr:HNH endonuclease signature motif containing protein [Paracoccus sulfuroxidans]
MTWHKTSSTDRGYGWAWQKKRRLAILRDRGLCVPCLKQGRTRAFDAVDHIKPRHEGGTDDLVNLQCICDDCHAFKTQGERHSKDVKPVGIDGWTVY